MEICNNHDADEICFEGLNCPVCELESKVEILEIDTAQLVEDKVILLNAITDLEAELEVINGKAKDET